MASCHAVTSWHDNAARSRNCGIRTLTTWHPCPKDMVPAPPALPQHHNSTTRAMGAPHPNDQAPRPNQGVSSSE
ncbi:hypothetical protein R1flu_005858 [Riccia fluitans]|uniref:Uncharacterized protein n=1 Tax=Riccia fluitans TaxID=41844 RepID=A0ABD1YVA0_9MARC